MASKGVTLSSRQKAVASVVAKLEDVYGAGVYRARLPAIDELVACILSQNTSDTLSWPAFTRLLEAFPSWEAVAKSSDDAIEAAIGAAGLAHQKGLAIRRSLTEIYNRTGKYSLDSLRSLNDAEALEWLESLPGVGPKTASIVLCFAMGRNVPPVDTHIFRVLVRLGWAFEKQNDKELHGLLRETMPPDFAYRFHIALLQHGRSICKTPVPLCDRCPLQTDCRWFKGGGKTRQTARVLARRDRMLQGRKKND